MASLPQVLGELDARLGAADGDARWTPLVCVDGVLTSSPTEPGAISQCDLASGSKPCVPAKMWVQASCRLPPALAPRALTQFAMNEAYTVKADLYVVDRLQILTKLAVLALERVGELLAPLVHLPRTPPPPPSSSSPSPPSPTRAARSARPRPPPTRHRPGR